VRTGALAQALWRGLREKSVQIYLNDPNAQRVIRSAGWGGVVEPGEGDYLFVVDSNVGFNKVNARVERKIDYAVDLSQAKPTAIVTITYTNPSRQEQGECDLHKQHRDDTYASMEESCYWNYVRVLTPRGSKLLAATGVDDAGVADDNWGVRTFGGYAIVPRNAERTVEFQYELLTKPITDRTYSLKVQQQAGIAATPITMRITLPEGFTAGGASHPFRMLPGNVVEFQETMYHDTTFEIYINP
jgi:hypothetical protein